MAGGDIDMADAPVEHGTKTAPASAYLNFPDGCPKVPDGVDTGALIAVVTMHHDRAFEANEDISYSRMPLVGEVGSYNANCNFGCTIFLHGTLDRPTYTFGRYMPNSGPTQTRDIDVFLPTTAAAKRQFTLVPVRETSHEAHRTGKVTSSWRIESTSETITTVNGVPIQKQTFRTKKTKMNNPHAVYLDDSRVNCIEVSGMKIDMRLVRNAGFVLDSIPEFRAGPLSELLQLAKSTVHETWAQSRYILNSTAEPIAHRSHRVLQRFTGRIETAKLFPGPDGLQGRDREFLMFYKMAVHDSLVKYHERTIIDGIPAIITSSHHGLVPYGALQASLKTKHPTYRFRAAAAIIRPVFSALEFLHHRRIVHNSDNFWDSVLLRFENNRVFKVLLVDYSAAYTVPPEEELPRLEMLNDSRMAMELIEDCCNIWALRQAPAPHAVHQDEMRRRTEAAESEFTTQQNACRYFFANKGDPRYSAYGKKMFKVLAQKEMNWERSRTDQFHNAGQLQIDLVTRSKLQEVAEAWEISKLEATTKARFSQNAEELESEQPEDEAFPMVLTLGHKFLDDLANKLYHTQWDLLPRAICAKLRSLEGEVQNPWRTFAVMRPVSFQIRSKECLLAKEDLWIEGLTDYFVTYCDIYPELRNKIKAGYEYCLRNGQSAESLCTALNAQGVITPAMQRTLRTLTKAQTLFNAGQTVNIAGTKIELLADGNALTITVPEEHSVCYHVPSGLFNITQMHKLQSTSVLEDCLAKEDVRCESFVEVRGEASMQGHYVPLSLLPKFTGALQLTISKKPEPERSYTGVNPSDFSQVSPGRVVLAHSGLVAFATVTRTGGQFSHLPTSLSDIESADPFLPTYFGDTKVLPSFSDGKIELPRADHWAKFKSVEDIERDKSLAKQEAGLGLLSQFSEAVSRRELVITGAHAPLRPPKRPRSEGASRIERLTKLRRENFGLTSDFLARNPNVLRSPPHRGFDPDQPFEPIDREATTQQERREFRWMSKFWTETYPSSDYEHDEDERAEDSVKPNTGVPAPLLDSTGQVLSIAGGTMYGESWLVTRQVRADHGSVAASAGMETELADTETVIWGLDVEDTSGRIE